MTSDANPKSNLSAIPSPYPPADFRRKIVSPEVLARGLESIRSTVSHDSAPRVVQCHGCFDIVHPGHIRYLQFARSQGDILVVSITGDATIDKEPQRPYIPQELRAENLAALEFVDWVVIDPHPTAKQLLARVRPDIYVKGREYATSSDQRFLAEKDVVESYGGRVIFSSGEVVFSSSHIIETMPPAEEMERRRLEFLCRRHGIKQTGLARRLMDISGRRVLVVGDSLIERYVYCDAKRVANESPMMSLKELHEVRFAGGAALIALQLAALGARPTLITGLADTELSRWLRTCLTRCNVEIRAVARDVDLPLRSRFIVDDQKLMLVERSEPQPVESERESESLALIADASIDAEAMICFDCDAGLFTPNLLTRLADIPHPPICVGGASAAPSRLPSMKNMQLVFTSERKLRLELNDLDSGLSTLVYQAMQRGNTGAMIVSLGKRGLVTFQRPSEDPDTVEWQGRLLSEHLPAFIDRAIDHFGCGEIMAATALAAMTAGAEVMEAAYLGSVAASEAAMQSGPVAVELDRIHNAIRGRSELCAAPGETRRGRVA